MFLLVSIVNVLHLQDAINSNCTSHEGMYGAHYVRNLSITSKQ